MSFDPLRILVPESLAEPVQAALAVSTAAPFEVVVRRGEAPFDAAGFDAVLLEFPATESDLPAHSAATALVMVCEGEVAAPSLLDWLRQGAADVVTPHDLRTPSFGARLRVAVERRRIDRAGAPGLRHRPRHRPAAPPAAGRAHEPPARAARARAGADGGAGAAHRRASQPPARGSAARRPTCCAARSRCGCAPACARATSSPRSATTATRVLLAALLAPGDAAHVGAKLLTALRAPFQIAGQEVAVATALGIALHLQDGAQPDALLRARGRRAGRARPARPKAADSAGDGGQRRLKHAPAASVTSGCRPGRGT